MIAIPSAHHAAIRAGQTQVFRGLSRVMTGGYSPVGFEEFIAGLSLGSSNPSQEASSLRPVVRAG
jgi:hypothetical protein